MNNILKEAM